MQRPGPGCGARLRRFRFHDKDLERSDFAEQGYQRGVPMGGDLKAAPAGKAPTLLIRALRDADGANLDRVQVVKGWLDADGKTQEKVYDVAWSGNRKPGKDGKLPPVGNTVNVKEASYTNAIGAPYLTAYWKDPGFDPKQRAFYYVRVIEIPTPRWTTYDAKFFGVTLPDGRAREDPGPRLHVADLVYAIVAAKQRGSDGAYATAAAIGVHCERPLTSFWVTAVRHFK